MGQNTIIYAMYTSKEKDIMHHLLRHLKSVQADYDVTIWHDDPITSGQQWKPKDESRLDTTDIFLLLVSNAFMYSEFIKQLEFKKVIDRYKAGKSRVVPLILEKCPWDIDFEADDYTFSFKELGVLPEAGKPLTSWDSTDEALAKSVVGIRSMITSLTENQEQTPSEGDKQEVTWNNEIEDQLKMPFSEEAETKSKEEELRSREEADIQKRAAEEKIALEKTQAKQKEAEERRLQEIAEAKKKTEEQNRIREEAEAKKRAHENWLGERMAATALEKSQVAPAAKFDEKRQESTQGEHTNKRKGVLIAISVAALVLLGIVLFFNSSSETSSELPSQAKEILVDTDSNGESDPTTKEEPKASTSNAAAATMSKPEIGARYGNGIIFEIDETGTNGKMAHLEDFGPMTWKDAFKINLELGEGWRLPTLDELKLMHATIGQGATNIGEFSDELYWSATPYDENQARLVRFSDGNTSYHYNSRGTHRKFLVRAIQEFDQ